jgi:hypothetical protein
VQAYLAARLVDVVLGDRARAREGWLWGWSEERRIWVPIARAQEQALLRAGSTSRMLLGVYQPVVRSAPETLTAPSPPARGTSIATARPPDRGQGNSVGPHRALDDVALTAPSRHCPSRTARGGCRIEPIRVHRDAPPMVVEVPTSS